MSRTATSWAGSCIGLLLSLAACEDIRPHAPRAEPVVNVTFAVAETPAPAPTRSASPRPLCSGLTTVGYSRLSNGWGHGSTYFTMLSRCDDEIRLDIDFYTEADALFNFTSDRCPDVRVGGNVVPKTAATSDEGYVRSVEVQLAKRLAAFRAECGVASTAGDRIFDGFSEIYAGEMGASWIHNRYIEKLAARNRLGWPDEDLLNEARREYAAAHPGAQE